jgi:hypothetical protein
MGLKDRSNERSCKLVQTSADPAEMSALSHVKRPQPSPQQQNQQRRMILSYWNRGRAVSDSALHQRATEEIPSKECFRKRVSFTNMVQVREYNVVLGDHPSTAIPLSLGWIVVNEQEHLLQTAAAHATRRVPCEERREWLLLEEYSEEELKRAQRKFHRAQQCCPASRKLQQREQLGRAQFFKERDALDAACR